VGVGSGRMVLQRIRWVGAVGLTFELLAQLQRIDDFFRDSPRLRELFRYIIEATWDGRQLSEKIILADFYKQDLAKFNGKNTPRVSVSIGRIREGLAEYYASAGAADPIIISIPKRFITVKYKFRSGFATRPRSSESSQTASDKEARSEESSQNHSDFETPPSGDSEQEPPDSSTHWRQKLIRRVLSAAVPVAIINLPIDFGLSLAAATVIAVAAGIGINEMFDNYEKRGRRERDDVFKQQTSEQPG
jgi:hypothetical protein